VKAFSYYPNKNNLFILFGVVLLIRIIVFGFYIQKNEYYKQPDSGDYHHAAISISLGKGMHRADNNRPMFWRTPGYPLYLSWFYQIFGIKSFKFEDNRPAQIASIIIQIILDSLMAILIFFLALLLTKSLAISWITAWIYVIHIGFILSSTYILTETLGLVFIFPFFYYFYKSFGKQNWIKPILLAALFLSLHTWIRPMGQFLSVVSAIIILIADQIAWKVKFKKIALFMLVFFMLIAPWFVRNYNLTGKIFFCPMLGLYLNTFNAPKIVRDTKGIPLRQAIDSQYAIANKEAVKEYLIARAQGKHLVSEMVHMKAALPVILQHPFLFIRDWIKEVLKSTLDLYSSQLVEFAKGSYYYDPLEEFLTEKFTECLYKQKMHPFMRLIVYLELLFAILLWIGLLAGASVFMLYPLIKQFKVSDCIKKVGLLWLKISPMIGAFVIMTGGFGYARLRLPAEPLMTILSLTFWFWLFNKNKG